MTVGVPRCVTVLLNLESQLRPLQEKLDELKGVGVASSFAFPGAFLPSGLKSSLLSLSKVFVFQTLKQTNFYYYFKNGFVRKRSQYRINSKVTSLKD